MPFLYVGNHGGLQLTKGAAQRRLFSLTASGGTALVSTKTPTVKITKNGAALGAAAGAVTNLTSGWRYISLTSIDTGTSGMLGFTVAYASIVNNVISRWVDVVVPNYPKTLLASAAAVWSAGTRTLTSAGVVWSAAAGTRVLGSGSAMWAANVRTLTSGLQVASSVWAHVSGVALGGHGRTLISGGVVWTNSVRTLTSGLSVASSVWAKGVRTLSSAGVVWSAAAGNRTLGSGASVWSAAARTLTSGLQVASSVWAHVSGVALGGHGRTLSSGNAVWTNAARTLTSGLNIASSVWVKGTRTLSSAGVVWTAVQPELAAIPAASPQAGPALMLLYMSARNGRTTSATGDQIKNAASTIIAKAPISATSTAFSRRPYA